MAYSSTKFSIDKTRGVDGSYNTLKMKNKVIYIYFLLTKYQSRSLIYVFFLSFSNIRNNVFFRKFYSYFEC